MSTDQRCPQTIDYLAFAGAGALLIAAVTALSAIGERFAFGVAASSMPIVSFVSGFVGIAVAMLFLLRGGAKISEEPQRRARWVLMLVFGVGLLARVLLLASEPVLETDFYRYLWDGGMTAHGQNPYAVAPSAIGRLPWNDVRVELSNAAAPIFERISYPELKTIYPATAQAAFALAHLLEPWSLAAWRSVCIAADVATFVLLLALLRSAGRGDLYVALYWWNPLVIKEIANSAHMEAVLSPLLLGALWASARGRHVAAVALLGLAAGAKVWPILLAPVLLRPLWGKGSRLLGAGVLLGVMLAAMTVPVVIGGLDATSGFVGFARDWSTNSALFPILQGLAKAALPVVMSEIVTPGVVVRALSASAVAVAAVTLSMRPISGPHDLFRRSYVIVSLLLILSPAQFPWYVLWVLPLAVLQPGLGWHVAAALMPIYYVSFHFLADGSYKAYERWISAAIWIPVWLTLARDYVQTKRRPLNTTRRC